MGVDRLDGMFEPMREELAEFAGERANEMAAALRVILADADVAGATSNQAVSIGAQVVAAQVLMLVERLLKRAWDKFPTHAPFDAEFLVEVSTEVMLDIGRRTATAMLAKHRPPSRQARGG